MPILFFKKVVNASYSKYFVHQVSSLFYLVFISMLLVYFFFCTVCRYFGTSVFQCTGACWAFALQHIKLPFILNGVCRLSEKYISNPFEILSISSYFSYQSRFFTYVCLLMGILDWGSYMYFYILWALIYVCQLS